jgi:hypothetical protein
MQMGLIDLDPDDKEVREQMYAQTYGTTIRRQLQITPKDKLPKSPDHLDAAIYAYYTPIELGIEPPGTVIAAEPQDIPDYGLDMYIRRDGQPLLL